MPSKPKGKDTLKNELMAKLNYLALNVLDEIYEARINKKPVDFEGLKAPLLAIKEIKDLIKINDNIKDGELSDLLNNLQEALEKNEEE